MNWVQRLKRVFRIDIETCQACGGAAGREVQRPVGQNPDIGPLFIGLAISFTS